LRCDQNAPPARREERSISKSIRDRRATQPPAHFHCNPPGRGRLAVFPRCSLLTYQSRYARRSRLEKQPTDQPRKPCYFADRRLAVGYIPETAYAWEYRDYGNWIHAVDSKTKLPKWETEWGVGTTATSTYTDQAKFLRGGYCKRLPFFDRTRRLSGPPELTMPIRFGTTEATEPLVSTGSA
jgi:hypothetical protein